MNALGTEKAQVTNAATVGPAIQEGTEDRFDETLALATFNPSLAAIGAGARLRGQFWTEYFAHVARLAPVTEAVQGKPPERALLAEDARAILQNSRGGN